MTVAYKAAVFIQERVDSLCVRANSASQVLPQTNIVNKKILIVTSHFWPSIGGLENRLEQFSTELVSAGYDVSLLTLDYPGRDASVRNGVKIISIKPNERVGIVRAWPYIVRKSVLSGDYNACILIQNPFSEVIWSIEGVTPPSNTKVIIQPIINAEGYSRLTENVTFCRRLTSILKAAAAVVVLTHSGADKQFMLQNDISSVYIPNATTLNESSGDFRQKYRIDENSFLVLHVANLYWVKNHLGLLKALQNLPGDWKLVLIGNPTGEPECVRAVYEYLEQRPEVLFISGLDRNAVSTAMEAADVVVLSSFGEGSPNTILEAMSHNKPWLATPQCGAANDNAGGIICPVTEFYDHLTVLQMNPDLRASLGKIGYRHWQECFSWPKVIASWIDLIETSEIQRSSESQSLLEEEMVLLRGIITEKLKSYVSRDATSYEYTS